MNEISSKSKIKTLKHRHLRRSVAGIVNFEHFTHCFGASIVDFEQVNTVWVGCLL